MKFLAQQKILPEIKPVERVFTNDLIDAINKYDRAKVIADAKKEYLSKLK